MYINKKHMETVTALGHINSLMKDLKPEIHLIVAYIPSMDEETMKQYGEWYTQKFQFVTGNEYVVIHKQEGDEWPPLYAINVTGNSVQYIAAETMTLLAKKF